MAGVFQTTVAQFDQRSAKALDLPIRFEDLRRVANEKSIEISLMTTHVMRCQLPLHKHEQRNAPNQNGPLRSGKEGLNGR